MPNIETISPPDSPILWGHQAIAREVGLTERATLHLLEKRRLPARKVGNRWCADRGALRQFFNRTEMANG